MEMLRTALEFIGAIEWIALGIFAAVKVRSHNRRLDEIISKIEGDLRNGG